MAREAQFITGQIQCGDTVAVGQQRVKLFFTGGLAEGPAHDANQTCFNVKCFTTFFYTGNHRFDYTSNRQLVRHRHIAWRKTQLNVMQAIAGSIFDIFIGNAAAGIQ